MTAVQYVPYELVVAINQEAGGDGAGVRDESGIRAALGRAESSFRGVDLYPTLAEKAAVLLHGLASTQYFHDGNKRTAWIVAKLFLKMNGHALRETFDVEAEAFVLSIATKAFETEGESARGIRKATEWYGAKRFTAADRVVYAFFGASTSLTPDRTRFSGESFGMEGTFFTEQPPLNVMLELVMAVQFRDVDLGREYTLEIELASRLMSSAPIRLAAERERIELGLPRVVSIGHPSKPDGIPQWLLRFGVPLHVRRGGSIQVRVLLSGETLVEIPFSLQREPSAPDDARSLS